VLDFQRDVLPVLRLTYDLMDAQQDDFLDGDELAALVTEDRDEAAVYRIFKLLNRTGYADVQFAGAMTVAFVQPTEKGLQTTRGWPVPGQVMSTPCCGSWMSGSLRLERPTRSALDWRASAMRPAASVNPCCPACSARGSRTSAGSARNSSAAGALSRAAAVRPPASRDRTRARAPA
jgi:hypothetical protein